MDREYLGEDLEDRKNIKCEALREEGPPYVRELQEGKATGVQGAGL